MSPARIEAVAATARAWRDPDHPDRVAAVEATLAAPNRYTEESLAFALNHAMHALSVEALQAWTEGAGVSVPRTFGVVCGGAPLGGFREWLAVMLLGHQFVGVVSDASPALLPAFARAVEAGGLPASRFVDAAQLEREAEAVLVAEGADVPEDLAPALPLWRAGGGAGVAVLGGREGVEERSDLAVDLLLHEGASPRSVHLVWAPAGLDPDPYLDALAGFRELFPPHPDTDGSLRMPAAFLAAAKQPHAQGPGFLVSKGEPEVMDGAHIRWAEYGSLADVEEWLGAHRDEVAFVVAGEAVRPRLQASSIPVVALGDAHRPALLDGTDDLRQFLLEL